MKDSEPRARGAARRWPRGARRRGPRSWDPTDPLPSEAIEADLRSARGISRTGRRRYPSLETAGDPGAERANCRLHSRSGRHGPEGRRNRDLGHADQSRPPRRPRPAALRHGRGTVSRPSLRPSRPAACSSSARRSSRSAPRCSSTSPSRREADPHRRPKSPRFVTPEGGVAGRAPRQVQALRREHPEGLHRSRGDVAGRALRSSRSRAGSPRQAPVPSSSSAPSIVDLRAWPYAPRR